jgi:hypothetical protein
MRRYPGAPHDIIWYVAAPDEDVPELPRAAHFAGPVETVVMRSAWNDLHALFVGVKAGYNQVNHGHLDLGTFVLDALGVRWACDLGSDNYNLPDYWDKGPDSARWTYYRLGSLSHNVPAIDGRLQNVHAKSTFLKVQTEGDGPFAVVDLTDAYKGQAESVTRGIHLLAWGLTTRAEITLDGTTAVLAHGGKTLTARILSPKGAVFSMEGTLEAPPQRPNPGVRRLMIRLKDQEGDVRVAVLLSPRWQDGRPKVVPELTPLAEW